MEEKKVVKVKSVAKARRAAIGNNTYAGRYGELLWSAALLTAYQNGGYKELKYIYEKQPLRITKLLLDAYRFKNTEQEAAMARAVSLPNLKKKDKKNYTDELEARLMGNG